MAKEDDEQMVLVMKAFIESYLNCNNPTLFINGLVMAAIEVAGADAVIGVIDMAVAYDVYMNRTVN